MKPGSWPSILAIYALGVCGGSTVSKIVPLSGEFATHFGVAASSFGWLVSLVAIPAAVLAIPSGAVVDRLGPRLVLLLATALGIVANLTYLAAPSLAIIRLARLLDGVAIVHIYTAGPAMLMATTEGHRRTRAMTLWSTYAPVGTAIGLVIGSLFASSAGWRGTFALQAALYAAAGLVCWFQPRLSTEARRERSTVARQITDLGSAFLRPMLVFLALAFFLMISLGLGANVTLPGYLAQVHHIPLKAASTLVATTTLSMLLGSLAAGLLIPRGVRPVSLFVAIAVLGLLAGVVSFDPAVSLKWRSLALLAWFIITGGGLATILATLPVVADPQRPGSAAAMINFVGALATFLNPPLWLGVSATGRWLPFVALLLAGWLGALTFVYLAVRSARKPATKLDLNPSSAPAR